MIEITKMKIIVMLTKKIVRKAFLNKISSMGDDPFANSPYDCDPQAVTPSFQIFLILR